VHGSRRSWQGVNPPPRHDGPSNHLDTTVRATISAHPCALLCAASRDKSSALGPRRALTQVPPGPAGGPFPALLAPRPQRKGGIKLTRDKRRNGRSFIKEVTADDDGKASCAGAVSAFAECVNWIRKRALPDARRCTGIDQRMHADKCYRRASDQSRRCTCAKPPGRRSGKRKTEPTAAEQQLPRTQTQLCGISRSLGCRIFAQTQAWARKYTISQRKQGDTPNK